MAEIYRNTRVVAWLGAGSKSVYAAFDILDYIHEKLTIFDKKADERVVLGLDDIAQEPLSEMPSRP